MFRLSSTLSDLSRTDAANRRVLLVENSRFYAEMVAGELRERLGLDVVTTSSLAEARRALQAGPPFFLALTGLVLADGNHDQIIALLTAHRVPTVVVTGVYDEATRLRLAEQPIIDYVLKDAPGNIEYLIWLVRRLDRNRSITALVVADSVSTASDAPATTSGYIAQLLSLYGFNVVHAEGGPAGLAALEADATIRLIVVEHEMAQIDGIEFVRRARTTHARDMLSIVGISAGGGNAPGNASLVARFLKHGANDFVRQPFSREEFFSRISQNIDNLELIGTLQDLATRDFLTGLPNRRHFFDLGARLVARTDVPIAVAMLDIDHFKHVNDSFGHDAGDVALCAVATAVARYARAQDVAARFGGEEFCVLAPRLAPGEVEEFFDGLRRAIADLRIVFKGEAIPVTVSIGVCYRADHDLHALLTDADRLLYLAKAGGRNQVVSELATLA